MQCQPDQARREFGIRLVVENSKDMISVISFGFIRSAGRE